MSSIKWAHHPWCGVLFILILVLFDFVRYGYRYYAGLQKVKIVAVNRFIRWNGCIICNGVFDPRLTMLWLECFECYSQVKSIACRWHYLFLSLASDSAFLIVDSWLGVSGTKLTKQNQCNEKLHHFPFGLVSVEFCCDAILQVFKRIWFD